MEASSSRPRTNRVRGVCRYYSQPAGCFAGHSCKFLHVPAHVAQETHDNVLSPYDANKVCRYYVQGWCRRGAECWFKHEMPNASAQPPEVAPPSADDDEYMCAICLEKPEEYGLLEECNHVYCRSCIRGWREQQGKSVDVLISQMNKTCPSCRKRSRFIIPSSRFPTDDESKKTIIDNYKASMARVDCKYFIASRDKPFCPYGRDCFYRHARADGTPHVFAEGVDELMEQWKRRRMAQAAAPTAQTEADFITAIRSIADSLFEVAAASGITGTDRERAQRVARRHLEDALLHVTVDVVPVDIDGMPPLHDVSDDESSDGDWEDSDPEEEAVDAQFLRAVEQSIAELQAHFNGSATHPAPAAPTAQRPPSPDPNRQFDVFDLD